MLEEDAKLGFPMRLHEIASLLRVKPPSALNIVKRLQEKGLAKTRDGMIALTEPGIRTAKSILLVHRTYESLLCQSGASKNSACLEASEVDFIIPEEDARMILKKIGDPKYCPHGKPIPDGD